MRIKKLFLILSALIFCSLILLYFLSCLTVVKEQTHDNNNNNNNVESNDNNNNNNNNNSVESNDNKNHFRINNNHFSTNNNHFSTNNNVKETIQENFYLDPYFKYLDSVLKPYLVVKKKQYNDKDIRNHQEVQYSIKPLIRENDIAVSIISAAINHKTKLLPMLEVWSEYIPLSQIYVFTDDCKDEAILKALYSPNHCILASSYIVREHMQAQKKFYKPFSYFVSSAAQKGLRLDETFKWFALIDDDALIFLPNVIYFLSDLDHNRPYFLSQVPKDGSRAYGGAGMIFSAAGFGKLESLFSQKLCSNSYFVDLDISKCWNQHMQTPMLNGIVMHSQPLLFQCSRDGWRDNFQFGIESIGMSIFRTMSFHYLKVREQHLHLKNNIPRFAYDLKLMEKNSRDYLNLVESGNLLNKHFITKLLSSPYSEKEIIDKDLNFNDILFVYLPYNHLMKVEPLNGHQMNAIKSKFLGSQINYLDLASSPPLSLPIQFSSELVSNFGMSELTKDEMISHVLLHLQSKYTMYNESKKWIFITTDRSYVKFNSVVQLLKRYNHEVPLYIGGLASIKELFDNVKIPLSIPFGASFIVSRTFLQTFSSIAENFVQSERNSNAIDNLNVKSILNQLPISSFFKLYRDCQVANATCTYETSKKTEKFLQMEIINGIFNHPPHAYCSSLSHLYEIDAFTPIDGNHIISFHHVLESDMDSIQQSW